MFRGSSTGGASTTRRAEARRSTLLLMMALLLLGACRQKMANQPRYDPLEPSDFFADGMSARPRIAGTVARGEISENPVLETGKLNGQPVDGFPMATTPFLLERGHERYDVYCSPCHGRLGDGNGMIPARGLRRPPSFHTQTLRAATTGHYFDVITNGFGAMPPYATQVPPQDRWAIIAYIRALQLSQNATVNDVPADDRGKLNDTTVVAADPAHTTTGGGGH